MAEEESISLQLLRFLVGRVDQQAQVPDARLLLRDAVAALRRGFCRRSVIDAAAAVEIALSDAHRTQCPNIPLGTKATLGTKVKKLSSALSLPTNLKADLVDIRNDAIHNNVIPDPSSTRSALGLAEQVLHQLEPLPTP
ncbi:MAG: hypothetical protein U5R31_13295 [Acidimicrobiia bacterium]|nr:hypothetical protein [Acidimicrobiia bacterium]